MSWKTLVVLTLITVPALMALLLWLLTVVSGGRVQCHWRRLWRHCCWLLPCVHWFLLVVLAGSIQIESVVTWKRSSEIPYAWSKLWPQSNHWLVALYQGGQLPVELPPDEQLRRVVRELLTLYFGESAGCDRERSRLLLVFRDRFAGAGPLPEAVAERLRLAEEGWAVGDYRNSGLLYALVCDQLERELQQRPMRDRASGRLAELRRLACYEEAGFSDSESESASPAEQLELELQGLSQLESECGQIVQDIRGESAEYLAATANRGLESSPEYLMLELDKLRVERDQLQQRRKLVEQLWVQRQR